MLPAETALRPEGGEGASSGVQHALLTALPLACRAAGATLPDQSAYPSSCPSIIFTAPILVPGDVPQLIVCLVGECVDVLTLNYRLSCPERGMSRKPSMRLPKYS